MSYLSPIHRLGPSPQPQSQSVNTWPLWQRTRLPVKASRWLVQQKFNDSRASSEEQVGKTTVPLYSAQWKGEGNQREGGESEGVREWAREGKHKRLLSVIGLPFNSPQGRHTPHFPSSHIQAVLNSDPIALISFFFTCNTIRCLNFNKHEGVSTYSHVFAPSTGFKWRSVSWRPPGKGDRINPEVTWDTETSHIEKSQINRLNVITLPQRTSPVRVCLTRVATH